MGHAAYKDRRWERQPAAEAAFGREQARDLAELDGRMRTERGGA